MSAKRNAPTCFPYMQIFPREKKTCYKTSLNATERSFGSLPIEAAVLLLFFVILHQIIANRPRNGYETVGNIKGVSTDNFIHPKIKLQRLRKIRIWTFGSLVHQINSFQEVLKLKQIFQKNKAVTGKTPLFVVGQFCSCHSICVNIGF